VGWAPETCAAASLDDAVRERRTHVSEDWLIACFPRAAQDEVWQDRSALVAGPMRRSPRR